jgi:hypothetical protein
VKGWAKSILKGKFGLPTAIYPTIMLSKGFVMVADTVHLGNIGFTNIAYSGGGIWAYYYAAPVEDGEVEPLR